MFCMCLKEVRQMSCHRCNVVDFRLEEDEKCEWCTIRCYACDNIWRIRYAHLRGWGYDYNGLKVEGADLELHNMITTHEGRTEFVRQLNIRTRGFFWSRK